MAYLMEVIHEAYLVEEDLKKQNKKHSNIRIAIQKVLLTHMVKFG